MKRLFREAGALTWLFAGAVVCAVVVSVTIVALADVFGRALSLVVAGAGVTALRQVIIVGIVAGAASIECTFLSKLLAGHFSERLQRRIRDRAVERLAHATAAAMHGEHSGDVQSRLSSDMVVLEQLVRTDVLQFVSQSLTALLAAAYMLSRNWLLTIVAVAPTPILLLVASYLTKPLGPLMTSAQEALGRAGVATQEAVSGAEVIRAMNIGTAITARHEHALTTWQERSVSAAHQVAKLYSTGVTLSIMPFIAVFGVGGYLALAHRIELGLLFSFVQLVNYLSFPVQEMPRLLGRIRQGTAAAHRVLQLLDLPVERTGGIRGPETANEVIGLENVSFAYPGAAESSLRDVSLTVRRGQKVALVGGSGSGKSTVVRLVTGDFSPDTGAVLVNGLSVQAWDLAALRTGIAVVDQEAFLFGDSVSDNVRAGRLGATKTQVNEALDVAAADFVDDMAQGEDTLVGDMGGRLSGGQRQRLALARALVKEAPLIVLDEATSALDNELERRVYAQLLEHYPDRTVVAVAHRLTTIRDADMIYVFDHGSVVEEGTHDSLLAANGRYALLWNLQQTQENNHE
ncbi:MAG: ABC transporter ATP-binding protein [Caldiserica bacterium]|nr:ABC transporter ATP-binding protein [Caldisericota bacterium]